MHAQLSLTILYFEKLSYYELFITEYLKIDPQFASTSEATSFTEESDVYFVCTATISLGTTLQWESIDSSQNVTEISFNQSLGVLSICQNFSRGIFSAVTARNYVSEDQDGALVKRETVAIVFCNPQQSMSGVYKCGLPNEADSITLTVQVESPQQLEIIVSVVCVLVLLLAIAGLILLRACCRYNSVKNSPQRMWLERSSPLIRDVCNPMYSATEDDDTFEFPREKLELGPVLGIFIA